MVLEKKKGTEFVPFSFPDWIIDAKFCANNFYSAYNLLLLTYRLLHTAYCLLPTAYCLLLSPVFTKDIPQHICNLTQCAMRFHGSHHSRHQVGAIRGSGTNRQQSLLYGIRIPGSF